VLLVALPNTGLPEVVTDLNKRYAVRAFGYELDLTSRESSQTLLTWCTSNRYQVNMLINNAGFGNLCSFEETDPALITTMMTLNNQSLVLMTHRFIPMLKRNSVSHILNVGSLASFLPIPNKSVYAATKSFVYAFSSALRLELMSSGVYVSCLCPGGTVTSLAVQERAKKVGGFSNTFVQQPEVVAREAVQGMLRRKQKIIPGWHNRALYGIRQILPEWVVCQLLTRIFRQRKQTVQKPAPGYSLALVFR
jgi:uncharacterized protein